MPGPLIGMPPATNPQVVTGQLNVQGSGTAGTANDQPEILVQTIASQTAQAVVVQNSAGVNKFTVDQAGNTAVAGTLAVTGASTFTGQATFTGGVLNSPLTVVVSAATTLAPTAAQSGTLFLLTGAAPAITLPAAAVGLQYGFMFQQTAGNTQMTIATGTASIVRGKTTGAGTTTINSTATTGNLHNTTATSLRGDMMWLVSDGTDWYSTMVLGTWAAT